MTETTGSKTKGLLITKFTDMTDEQIKQWIETEEGGQWLTVELKKKLHEYEQLLKLSRERSYKKRNG